jgi:hypothetical protein
MLGRGTFLWLAEVAMNEAGSPLESDDHPVTKRIRRPGPKRILALDSGGLRGVVTLAYLKKIETLLRQEVYDGNPDFRLRDHYDMIGGTSTGAIIATGLALGRTVDQLIALYLDLGRHVFARPRWRPGIIGSRLSNRAYVRCVRAELGEATLGSREITCALVVVCKRMDTESVWVLHNNPSSRYYDPPDSPSIAVPNKDLPLYRIVCASTAAPTYLTPEFIEIARGTAGVFIDGAVSPHANPALLQFLVATVPAYGYSWETGERMLHLTSIGTGLRRTIRRSGRLARLPSIFVAMLALRSVINDCRRHTHMVLQSMSAVNIPWKIDREAGYLTAPEPASRRLLSYTRFELPLEVDWLAHAEWLSGKLAAGFTDAQLAVLGKMDNRDAMETLYELASAAAEYFVKREFLEPCGAPGPAIGERQA